MNGRVATLAASVAMTLVAGTAWAYWSVDSTPGGNGGSAATSVNQGAQPTASAVGQSVTVSWAATTLANGQPVSGYLIKRLDSVTLAEQTIGSACAGVVATTSCVEANVPGGTWRYSVTPVIGNNWRGAESTRSSPVVVVGVDVTAPTNNLSLSSVTGGAYLSGTTVYYRGTAAGGFSITNAVADAGSGPASSQTAALTGTTTGWTHTPSTVSAPAGGPYVSNTFSWAASTTSSPGEAVTGRDVANNAAVTNLTFTNDSTAPTAGSITYANGFASGRSASISFTTGTDSGAGIATRRLQRAQATLNSDQSCGTFGGFTNIGADAPTSPYVDSSLATACYMYRYVVTDRVGNQHIATSANVVKIGYAGAVGATAGLLSHWRLGEGSATLTASDSLNGTTGSALNGRPPDQGGGTWVYHIGTNNETISAQGQAYRNGGAYGVYYTSAAPSSADYSVEADLVYKSNLPGEMAGVVGRFDAANNDYYFARWEEVDNSWNIGQVDNGVLIGYPGAVINQPDLVVGHNYRVRLEMSGGATTTLRLYVNGVLTVTATDNAFSPPVFTTAGRAGIIDGNISAAVAKDANTGVHFDNFQVTPSTYPRAADDKGSNTGDYKNGVTLGAAGALAAGTNTAATFDGVNDHVQMTGTTGIPVGAAVRSTELWFKTSSANRQVLFRYGSGTNTQEYGLWIEPGGATMTAWGWGTGNDKTFTMPSAVNNGAWHHVVMTYNGTQLTIYIDGVALAPQAASRGTVMDQYGFGIGAVIRPNDGNSGGFFQGSIDEVSFYTTVLNQSQVTDHYELGNAPAMDTSGPTGGSIDATGLTGTGSRYSTSTTLNLAFTKGTDPSGVAASGHEVRRASATLTNGTCGSFGSYTLVSGGSDPSSPLANSVSDQACYSYRYVVLDTLGNATTYTSPDIKVDTTVPATPTLSFATFSNTWWPGSGSTVYFRSAATSGSFTATAAATDAASGIASYSFPTLGTNWTSTPGALGVNTYGWSGAPAAPGTKNVTATNNAGRTSANAPFTMTADDTAPSAGTVTYANGSTSGSTVSVSFATGTDAGSGIGTRLLQRASAPVTGGTTCGSYGGFSTVTNGTNPTSPVTDTIAAGNCYKYQYVVADNVGNQHVASNANVAHTAFGAHWTFDEASGSAADSTGNGHTATLQAGASRTAGKIGTNALNLTGGSTSWASTPAPVIDTSQSYTVAAWVRPSSLAGFNQTVVAADGSSVSPFYLKIEGGTYVFHLRGSDSTTSSTVTATGVAAVVGTWAHLAAVHDNAADTVSIYVNGVLRSTVAFNSPWKANGATTVGRAKWNGGNVDYVSGAIDDVRLYDRVLTAGEIDDLVPAVSYFDTVSATTGLLNYYRLGESVTSADSMTGSAGATLQSRNGAIGATWTKHSTSDADAVLTDAGRVRKGGAPNWSSLYHASGTPASADYTVEADVYVASNLTNDQIGVVGRLDTTAGVETYYLARYEQGGQTWALYRRVAGSWDWLGASAQALTVGATYRLKLDMTGTSIRVLVDGVERIAVVDAGITAAGRGGVSFGYAGAATTVTNTTGLHLDNFGISPPLADSKGTNRGDFFNGVTLGTTGAITGDSNTAATFDGSNDHATVPRQISDDFSIELWFKAADGIGTSAQWWGGAGLVDAEVGGAANDFGISLRSDGRVVAGVGQPDVSVVSTNGGYDNNAWHQVVFTRTRSTGAMALYVDGVAAGTATGSTAALTSSATLTFGRIQGTANYLAGSLDEVALYSTVLSAGTVAAHYSAGTS